MDYQEAIRDIQFLSRRYDDLPNVNYSISRESLDIAIFTMNELRLYKEGKLYLVPESVYSKQCEELDEYKALGTLEEVRAAVEKSKPKKITHQGCYDSNGVFHTWNGINGVPYDLCPRCGINLCTDGYFGRDKNSLKFCENCGQALDWSEEK